MKKAGGPAFALVTSFTLHCAAFAADLPAIESQLTTGMQALASRDFKAAISHCRKGIDALGDDYYNPASNDDSGMKLALAEIKAREGDWETSAVLSCRTLESRISSYKFKARSTQAQQSDPCSSVSEAACINSSSCKLVLSRPATRAPYSCRSNSNPCEAGFVQLHASKASCESRPQCSFQPSYCYCPPDEECRCGGGRPPMCAPVAHERQVK